MFFLCSHAFDLEVFFNNQCKNSKGWKGKIFPVLIRTKTGLGVALSFEMTLHIRHLRLFQIFSWVEQVNIFPRNIFNGVLLHFRGHVLSSERFFSTWFTDECKQCFNFYCDILISFFWFTVICCKSGSDRSHGPHRITSVGWTEANTRRPSPGPRAERC